MKTAIIIPARWASSRFPGKPLVLIAGKTLIQRVWTNCAKVKNVEGVWIATDGEQIVSHCRSFTPHVVMTNPECRNGTERVWDAAVRGKLNCDVYINVQGDSPLVPAFVIEELIRFMKDHPQAQVATVAVPMNAQEKKSPGIVAVALDSQGRAVSFSRSLSEKPGISLLRHVGLYAYREQALRQYCLWPPGRLEESEKLEQLRFMENGVDIYVAAVDFSGRLEWEVNHPGDVDEVEKILAVQGEP